MASMTGLSALHQCVAWTRRPLLPSPLLTIGRTHEGVVCYSLPLAAYHPSPTGVCRGQRMPLPMVATSRGLAIAFARPRDRIRREAVISNLAHQTPLRTEAVAQTTTSRSAGRELFSARGAVDRECWFGRRSLATGQVAWEGTLGSDLPQRVERAAAAAPRAADADELCDPSANDAGLVIVRPRL